MHCESELLVILNLNHHDFDGLVPDINIAVHGVGRVRGQPVSLSGFPDLRFGQSSLFRNFHRTALESNNHATMIMAMQRQRRIWRYRGLPNLYVRVLKLREIVAVAALSLGI